MCGSANKNTCGQRSVKAFVCYYQSNMYHVIPFKRKPDTFKQCWNWLC